MQNNDNQKGIVKQEPQQITNTPSGALAFNPAEVVRQATEASQALKGILDAKPKKVAINGEQYLEYEDWQTLARFYGFTVETGEAEEVWRDGKLAGYKAKSIVYLNGARAGGAEASCMRDEPKWNKRAIFTWKNGTRVKTGEELVPEFQLKSMAQTRAGSKGLRNVLAFVAVLAGYKPTPAEEMDGVVVDAPKNASGKTSGGFRGNSGNSNSYQRPQQSTGGNKPKCPECGANANDGEFGHRPTCSHAKKA